MFQHISIILSTTICHILILQTGVREALRCWQCSTETDRFCDDPINGTATVCDEEWGRTHHLHSHAVCKKVSHRVNGELVTVRSCGWDSSGTYGWGPCSTNALSQYPAVDYCGICQRDACNAADKKEPSPPSRVVLLQTSVVVFGLRLQTRLHL